MIDKGVRIAVMAVLAPFSIRKAGGREKMAVKYVFVTGGVVSGLGKRNHGGFPGKALKGKGLPGDDAEV